MATTPAKAQPPKPEPAVTDDPDAGLTQEQKEIKDLKDQLARALAKREVEEEEREAREAERESNQRFTLNNQGSPKRLSPTEPGLEKPGNVLIHFTTEFGFTALGKVWVRGEELELEPGTPEYEFTKDPVTGVYWVEMDEGDQLDKWDEVKFRPGPWRGKSLAQSKFERLAALASDEGFDLPSTAELAAAERASRLKGRKPPSLSAR